jgi:hypothetical protein
VHKRIDNVQIRPDSWAALAPDLAHTSGSADRSRPRGALR